MARESTVLDYAGAGPQLWLRDPVRAAVEAQSGGRQTILYDAAGHPNHMYVLPRFSYADLGMADALGAGNATAFEVAGRVKSEIFVGVYQACNMDGLGCSLPGAQPWVNVSYDEAVQAARRKGEGWHVMTAHEWAAIAFWCMANGFQPRGNVAFGSAGGRFAHECGLAYPNDAHLHRSGTGPLSWRHNGDVTGIADLVGNALEWNTLLKLRDGEVIATPDNDFTADESDWTAQGRYMDCRRGKLKLTTKPPRGEHTAYSVAFARLRRARGCASSPLLRRLLIEPTGINPEGRLYVRDHGERVLSRGGEPETGGGLAAGFIYDERDSRQPDVGFRVVYIP